MHELAGKKILVVGASGFIGRPLAYRLAAVGANVYAVCRNPPSVSAERNIFWSAGDAADANDVKEMFSSFRSEIVFNLTSDSQGGRDLSLIHGSLRNDVVATINVLHGAADAKVERFVMTHSFEAPDGANPTPLSPYAAAKWTASIRAGCFAKLRFRCASRKPNDDIRPGAKRIQNGAYTILS